MNICARWEKLAPCFLTLLRVICGLLMLQHGSQKLFGFPDPPHGAPEIHLFSLIGTAGILELAGGLLLVLGLFTRMAAFILSGEMAVAYFHAHFFGHGRIIWWPVHNGGELALVYCFVFFYISAAGGGSLSLDRLWCKSGAATPPAGAS